MKITYTDTATILDAANTLTFTANDAGLTVCGEPDGNHHPLHLDNLSIYGYYGGIWPRVKACWHLWKWLRNPTTQGSVQILDNGPIRILSVMARYADSEGNQCGVSFSHPVPTEVAVSIGHVIRQYEEEVDGQQPATPASEDGG